MERWIEMACRVGKSEPYGGGMIPNFDTNYDDGFETGNGHEGGHYTVGVNGAVATDDPWGADFDTQEVKEALEGDLPAEGDYTSLGLTSTPRKNQWDGEQEFYYVGRGQHPSGRTGRIAFAISRVKRTAPSGRPVFSYVLFQQAIRAFTKANGHEPQNGQELDQFLCTQPIVVRQARDKKLPQYLNSWEIKAPQAQASVTVDDDIPF